MAAGDIRDRGLICKHPGKGLKKAAALLVLFKVQGEYLLLWRLMHWCPLLSSSSLPLMGLII